MMMKTLLYSLLFYILHSFDDEDIIIFTPVLYHPLLLLKLFLLLKSPICQYVTLLPAFWIVLT